MTTVTVSGRRLIIHDREEWQVPSRPVTGPRPSPELVHWAVIHWPGASANWKPPSDVAAHLRWAQDSYLNDPKRGYSYGYGFVIGPNPINWDADPVKTDIWEVRGTDIRIASNDGDNGIFGQFSNPNFNGRSCSAQIMASQNFPATNDQLLQARWLVAYLDTVYGESLTVIAHRTSDATSCPGDYIASKIPFIATRPEQVPSPPPTHSIPPAPAPGGIVHMLICKYGGTPDGGWAGVYSHDGGVTAKDITGGMAQAATVVDLGALDAKTRQRITARNWVGVTHVATRNEAFNLCTPYG